MKQLKAQTLFDRVEEIKDPRVERTKLHLLKDILVMAVCATICGADNWEEIAEFGKSKREWFASFLELENGKQAPDTFRRVFILLDNIELQYFGQFFDCLKPNKSKASQITEFFFQH